MITFQDLLPTLQTLQMSSFEGIGGVMCIDSGVPGPTLGITICTHGNEPAGLAPLHFVLHNDLFLLQNGRILFILNNEAAAKKAFAAEDFEERGKYRATDINMNRLPQDIRETAPAENDPYEVQRVRALLPLYRQITVGLDLHSTSFPCETMLITMGNGTGIFASIPADLEIANIVAHSVGVPAIYYYGMGTIPAAVLECGYHEDPQTFAFAITAFQALLQEMQMIEGIPPAPSARRAYRVFQGVCLPDASYELTKVFQPFERLPSGYIYAIGDGPDQTTQCDSIVLFPFSYKKPPRLDEEVMFFAEETSITQ